MPSMWSVGSREPRYERLPQGVELGAAETDSFGYEEEPGEGSLDSRESSTTSSASPTDTGSLSDNVAPPCQDGALTPCQRAKQDGARTTVSLLITSVAMIFIVTSLSLGLGGYSVFVFKPAPVIDKSVDAFSIPNHRASRGYHALQEAKSERISVSYPRSHNPKRRRRRSARDNPLNSQMNSGSRYENAARDKRDVGAETPGDVFFRKHFSDLETGLDEGVSDAIHRLMKRSVGRYRRVCRSSQQCMQWKLQVIFMAVGEEDAGNMFTRERLETVHRVEQQVINHARYTDYCWKDPEAPGFYRQQAGDRYQGCAPLNSLLSYFYPSVLPTGKVRYDGRGSNMVDIKSALDMAMSSDKFYYFVDESINRTNHKSRLLRTEVLFGSPLKGYRSSIDRRKEQMEDFKSFIVTYINILTAASTSKVQVLYGGNELFDYEVESTFWRDLWLARFALISIGLFIFILTSFSLWLTLWALVAIGLSFPMAIFLYRVTFNIQALGILNGAAAFVVIGIGVDDVFVFVNTFRQAEHMDRIQGRLLYTVKTAGMATFFTSFTTAAAFAANIASVIPALHEFGLFMALIVACCWVSVVLLLPPVLYFWYILFAWLESLFFRALKYIFYKVVLRKDVNTLQVYYRSGSDEILTDRGGAEFTPFYNDDDDDVPMLQLEEDEEPLDPSQTDEPLLVPYISSTDPTFRSLTSDSQEKKKGRQLFDVGHVLQRGLCRFVTGPVIRGRWVVAVTYVVVLVVSVGLMTQIQVSSKPPQLFKEDTNLQMVLDLKANLSIDKFSCPHCSGLYKESQSGNTPDHTVNPYPPYIPGKWNGTQPPPETSDPDPYPEKPPRKPQKYYPTKGDKPVLHTTTALPRHPDTTSPRPVTTSTHRPRPNPLTTTVQPKPPATQQYPPHKPPAHSVTLTHHTTTPTTQPSQTLTPAKVSSLPKGFDVCQGSSCGKAQARPVMESGAVVYVVFGIRGLNTTNLTSEHVINDNYGTVMYDERFVEHFSRNQKDSVIAEDVRELCIVCKKIAANTDLVVNGSAQCLPTALATLFGSYLHMYSECENLPRDLHLYNQRAPGHAEARPTSDYQAIKWMAFAFESTTSKGQSYFKAYDEYLKWEKFISEVKGTLRKDSPLETIYQTSEFWTKVLMEVVCVSSAIYGVVLSVIICVIAVAVFTGHLVLLVIVLLTIGGIICLVVALFYVAGWEMGAVEAVSLSILVGSSVDYCVHVVEGYLLAGNSPQLSAIESSSKQRQWRVMQAIQHIGVSIVSSAITTIAAAIPLTQTTIRPFSRFGDIVAMNTTFAIVYTLTACSAFLALFGPARFKGSWKARGIALLVTLLCTGVVVLTLYILSRLGVNIPSPNGDALFPN